MDIVQTQDQAVETETPPRRRNREEKSMERLKKVISNHSVQKLEKKKSETKKLRKKLLEIEEQNETLSNTILEKNQEISELRKSVNSLNDVLNSVPIEELRCNSSIASTKLLELSKKNRQLRAEMETMKNRLTKKDIQIQKLERDLKANAEKFHQDTELLKKGNFTPLEELQSKCNVLQQKLFETRNRNIELHNQLKLAQKCLQQEIGEHVNINILASHPNSSNWRGRAQQILHLQQRVQDLKERLEASENPLNPNRHFASPLQVTEGQDNGSVFEGSEPAVMPTSTPALSVMSNLSLGCYDRPTVRKTEIQHRAKVEALDKEIANLKSQLEEQRGKILALKVRNKTLNDDVMRFKLKTNTLEEQTDFNTINVATMNDKLNQQKFLYEKRIDELHREVSAVIKQREETELKEEHMRHKYEEIKLTMNSKDEYIEELKVVVKKLETDLKAVCGGFLFSCRELRKEEFIAILDTLESEKNYLVQHNKTLNERIDQERHKNENLQELLSKQKMRLVRLEVKLRDTEKELSANHERRKRTQRISDYSNSLNNFSTSSSISSLTFENPALNSGKTISNCTTVNTNDINDINDMSDLKNRLELANEKLTILKEKLDYVTAEKENDLKTFEEIVNNSKTHILESILARRSGSGTSTEAKTNYCVVCN
uniref:Coiled-coil domain-containing protein 13 n=1 Tax=Glossina brevipalpis TaxID=37001 RepID=A0A1A9W3D3_9MUSC